MWSRITNIASVGEYAYMRVEFWPTQADRAGAPTLVNDFLFTRLESFQGIVQDEMGRCRVRSGGFVIPWVEVGGDWQERPDNPADPYMWETVVVDVATEALGLISEFVAGHRSATGDMSDPAIVTGPPAGVAARPDVQALVGTEREV